MQRLLCVLIFALLVTINVCSYADSTVRVIYFVPNDRTPNWNIPVSLDSTMKAVQKFYTEQMKSHGYNKTFPIEKDKDDNVVVHYIAGKINDSSYDYLKIEQEVKSKFDTTKDIFIVYADFSSGLIDGWCGITDFGGRIVVIPAQGDCVAGDNGVSVTAHELGHSFNLDHDFRDDTYIMSYGSNRNKLSKCAAHALNVNPFFNNRNYIGANANASIEILTTNMYPKGHDNWKLRLSVSDPDGIHQIQFSISNPVERASILECKVFDNTQNATLEFLMPKSATILPTNSAHISEWWEHIEFWEQTPDGKLGAKPWGAVPIESHIPYYDQWDYLFYSHAPSEIVYDLGDGDYEKFESKFFMPNPCNNIASVEVIFSADGTEI